MGHIQKMTDKQRMEWFSMTYKAKKEANLGFNFKYFNQKEWDKLESQGYEIYLFKDTWENNIEATTSVYLAKEKVEELRNTSHYARIICGYIQTRQREKHYTVIYKSKCKEKI